MLITLFALKEHFVFEMQNKQKHHVREDQNFCMNAHTSFLTPLKKFSPCPLCGGSVGSFL